jgi:hypothetical protein
MRSPSPRVLALQQVRFLPLRIWQVTDIHFQCSDAWTLLVQRFVPANQRIHVSLILFRADSDTPAFEQSLVWIGHQLMNLSSHVVGRL